MNQKGEAVLFCVLILVVLSGLLTLCGLELQSSFRLLEKRTKLFLCAKEAKEELHQYLKISGQTNWGLKNTSKAQIIAAFIPGLQGVAIEAEKLKKILKGMQNVALSKYLFKISALKSKGCPIDPQSFMTPFLFEGMKYRRGLQEEIILRKHQWTYIFFEKPYILTVKIDATRFENPHPEISYQAKETGGMWSFLFSSR